MTPPDENEPAIASGLVSAAIFGAVLSLLIVFGAIGVEYLWHGNTNEFSFTRILGFGLMWSSLPGLERLSRKDRSGLIPVLILGSGALGLIIGIACESLFGRTTSICIAGFAGLLVGGGSRAVATAFGSDG